jgi:hypothetical protein
MTKMSQPAGKINLKLKNMVERYFLFVKKKGHIGFFAKNATFHMEKPGFK